MNIIQRWIGSVHCVCNKQSRTRHEQKQTLRIYAMYHMTYKYIVRVCRQHKRHHRPHRNLCHSCR